MSATLKLVAPPGYGPIIPLDRQRHAGFGLKPATGYGWCAQLNAVYVGTAEMSRAALDYPLAFLREPGSGEFVPAAVLGLRQNQNLFVDDAGRWREGAYVPACFRRHPFCMVELPASDGQEARQLVCVQQDRLEPGGTPLFEASGEPAAAWKPMLQLIQAIEGARQQTRTLVRNLEALQLLTPFDAVAVPKAGGGVQMRLQGLFRVDEQKLQAIPDDALRQLMQRGELRAVYAHLVSLENFGRLLDLAQARG